ncbi:hypothetical protein ACHAW5_004747 [Stephanodiscus triporus]|uniref:Disease resistance R13L4/SHOC-2-like LRR domain-containing protein n=1 Tax=Stephanodiscus triporus TaxID=2934178 RepID=A0ABD3PFB9_9STRA
MHASTTNNGVVFVIDDDNDNDNINNNDNNNNDNNDNEDAAAAYGGANDGATILDDGLSIVDIENDEQQRARVTSADATRIKAEERRHERLSRCLLLATLFVSAIIAAAVVYSPTGAVPSSSSSSASSQQQQQQAGGGGQPAADPEGEDNGLDEGENESRLRRTLDYLVAIDASDPSTLLHPEGIDSTTTTNTTTTNEGGGGGGGGASYTPQYRAAAWLAEHDPLDLDVPWELSDDVVAYAFLQRYSIAVLYFALGGEDWLHGSNFLREWHECGWHEEFYVDDVGMGMGARLVTFGVVCDGEPDREDDVGGGGGGGAGDGNDLDDDMIVTGIALPLDNNVVGTLPPEVRHLRYLKFLHVQGNLGVTGEIPFESSSSSSRVRFCAVSCPAVGLIQNGHTGKIPRSFAFLKKLVYLDLRYNFFTGDTTVGDLDFLAGMSSLEVLTFDYNAGIVGTLPALVSNLTSLTALSLSNTGMYGALPTSLSRLTALTHLFLDDCAFSGSLDVVQEMTNLTHVNLEDNSFSGTVDDDFFVNSRDLVNLDVSNCSLRGYVPGHFFEMAGLEVLDMSENEIGGSLPALAANASGGDGLDFLVGVLKYLSLHTNDITGSIPSSIGNLRRLTTLDLSQNRLTGSIPSEIGDLLDLDVLFLGNNNFTGSIVPEWVRNLTGLSELSLKGSSLTGQIPAFLGDLTWLRLLDLGENKLTNTIPQALGNLENLVVLILNSNELVGELGLGQLANLETLLIDDNSLTGDTNDMCAHEIEYFVSDCASHPANGVEIVCSCCTLCCHDENATCNDADWLANPEGIWETGYNRIFWHFEAGSISPYFDYDIP